MGQGEREPLARRTITSIRLTFAILGLASMILGYFGLHRYLSITESPRQASYSSNVLYYDVELFLVQSTPLSVGGPIPWQLQVARFGAPTVALYAFAEFGAAVFAGRLRRSRLRRMKGHAIVCGSTRAANLLAARLRASGSRVLVLTADPPGTADREALVADPRLRSSLLAAGAARAASLYCCLDGYEDNAQTADAAEWIHQVHGSPRTIHVLMQNLDLCSALRARRLSVVESAGDHLDFFHLDELAALATVRGSAESLTVAKPEIAIVGTGAFARSVLLESARQWTARRSEPSDRLEVILIGDDAVEVAARLSGRYAFLAACCRITPRVEAFGEVLSPRREDSSKPPLRRLYLCQEDEGLAFTSAIDTALQLHATFDEIVVRLDRTAGIVNGFRPDRSGGSLFEAIDGRLRLVDVSAAGCDLALIDEGLTEQLARACHQHYLDLVGRLGGSAGHSSSMVGWEDLDEDYRAACRSQMVDVGRKLSMVGCLISLRHADAPRFAFRPDELELLAEREHERWSADRLGAGWTWGPERDDAARAHPSLVPWNDLDEQERGKDRAAVLTITPILADVGLMPIRTRVVEPGG